MEGSSLEHPLYVLAHACAALGIGAHVEVLLHAHLQEDAPPLRHLGQALFNYLVRRQLGDVLAAELYGARPGAEQARDGLQCRGLARAVRAYEGHDLALVHVEGHSLYGVDGAVIDVDVLDFQYLLHAQAPFFRPR